MINTNRDRARIAAENWPEAVPQIAPTMRILGLHHVTAIGTSIEGTEAFVAGRLGMRRVKRTNNFDDVGSFHWYWGVGGGPPGTLVTYFDRKPERERPGGDGRWSDRALRGCRGRGRSRAAEGHARRGGVARVAVAEFRA